MKHLRIICLIGIFLLTTATGKAADKLAIGLLPEMNVFQQMQRYQPLATYLSPRLGVDVKLVMLSRYGNIVETIRSKRVDAVFLGSFTGALCITQLGMVPLARPLFLDGTSTYYGKIFTRRDTGIKTVAAMQGKRLALVEQATTAGYIFPMAYFRAHGVNSLDSYFSKYFFTGSHDAAIMAVLEGQAEVGAAKNTIYEKVMKKMPAARQQLVVLKNSPPVPSNGLCLRPELAPRFGERLKNLLLGMHTERAAAPVLEHLGAVRFIPTTRKDYQVVIDIAEQAGIDLRSYKYRNQ